MKKEIIYHFCAMAQEGSNLRYFDGVINVDMPVKGYDDYVRLKEHMIEESDAFSDKTASDIIITSLSLLSEN